MNGSNVMKTHPVLIIVSASMTVLNSIIGCLVGFEIVHWTEVQIGLVVGLANALVAPITAVLTQVYTTPYDPEMANTSENVYMLKARIAELEGSAPPPEPKIRRRKRPLRAA